LGGVEGRRRGKRKEGEFLAREGNPEKGKSNKAPRQYEKKKD
jgi:hypothetical protein